MIIEEPSSFEGFLADVTFVAFLIKMRCSLVRLQIGSLGKGHWADVTFEWLLARVNPLVIPYFSPSRKRLPASSTQEGFIARMHNFVHSQIVRRPKGLIANITIVLFHAQMRLFVLLDKTSLVISLEDLHQKKSHLHVRDSDPWGMFCDRRNRWKDVVLPCEFAYEPPKYTLRQNLWGRCRICRADRPCAYSYAHLEDSSSHRAYHTGGKTTIWTN